MGGVVELTRPRGGLVVDRATLPLPHAPGQKIVRHEVFGHVTLLQVNSDSVITAQRFRERHVLKGYGRIAFVDVVCVLSSSCWCT